jgi:DNA-binding MarR family transcriptional regulator
MADSSRGDHLDAGELAAWHGMLTVHARLIRELDRRLRDAHGFGVSEFDVLITLYNADERGLRMTDLANAIVLSPAGLTHLVTRLERDRLVERSVDPADRRSLRVRLTELGQASLASARSVHNGLIRQSFSGRLTPRQLDQLGKAWAAILAPNG